MRYLSTLTFLLINAAVSHLCQAGIVLDSNGFVTQATLEVSGVSYDVTLTKGTYDSVDSQFTLSDELWFGDQSLASDFGNAQRKLPRLVFMNTMATGSWLPIRIFLPLTTHILLQWATQMSPNPAQLSQWVC